MATNGIPDISVRNYSKWKNSFQHVITWHLSQNNPKASAKIFYRNCQKAIEDLLRSDVSIIINAFSIVRCIIVATINENAPTQRSPSALKLPVAYGRMTISRLYLQYLLRLPQKPVFFMAVYRIFPLDNNDYAKNDAEFKDLLIRNSIPFNPNDYHILSSAPAAQSAGTVLTKGTTTATTATAATAIIPAPLTASYATVTATTSSTKPQVQDDGSDAISGTTETADAGSYEQSGISNLTSRVAELELHLAIKESENAELRAVSDDEQRLALKKEKQLLAQEKCSFFVNRDSRVMGLDLEQEQVVVAAEMLGGESSKERRQLEEKVCELSRQVEELRNDKEKELDEMVVKLMVARVTSVAHNFGDQILRAHGILQAVAKELASSTEVDQS